MNIERIDSPSVIGSEIIKDCEKEIVQNRDASYVIGATIVEDFEKEIAQNISRPLELFFKRIVQEKPSSIPYSNPGLLSRLLKLLPVSGLSSRHQAQTLLFFRSKTGIPAGSLQDDVIIRGKEGTIACSRQLLEACFPFFKNDNQKGDLLDVPLQSEALTAFTHYLFTKQIEVQDLSVLKELLTFSESINGQALQKCILSTIAKGLSFEDGSDPDLQFTPTQFHEFVPCYFKANGIEIHLTRKNKYSVSLGEFVGLFRDKTYVVLLHCIATEIDEIRFCDKDVLLLDDALSSILPQYRKAIVSVRFAGDILATQLENCIRQFPNYRPMQINVNLRQHPFLQKHFLSMLFASKEISFSTNELLSKLELMFGNNSSNIFVGELLSIAYKKMGALQDAEDLLRTIMSTDQYSYLAPYTLGTILLLKEEDDDAIAALNQSIKMNPKQISAYRLISTLFERKQQFGKAKAVLQLGLGIYPKDDQSLQLLAFLKGKAG